jgi:hypothetical protein
MSDLSMMTEKKRLLVCTRKRDMRPPTIKSSLKRCDICRELVWVAASSPTDVDEIMCTHCAVDVIEPGEEFQPLTPEQIADVRKAMSQ